MWPELRWSEYADQLQARPGLFSSDTSVSMFRLKLDQLLAVLAPIGKATTCLESSHSTVSDVFIFWLAVMSELHAVIVSESSGLDESVKEAIRHAANARWKQMFGKHDVYLTGFVLDPRASLISASFVETILSVPRRLPWH